MLQFICGRLIAELAEKNYHLELLALQVSLREFRSKMQQRVLLLDGLKFKMRGGMRGRGWGGFEG
jgi:hypothetical protein